MPTTRFTMDKITIKNRKGQKIVVLLQKAEKQKGLVFVVHGLGGTKGEQHIQTFAQTFRKKEFTVIRFDTTNTFGESDGIYEDATLTQHYADLEDVIVWATSQNWYQEPFYLVGHSFGGIASILYTEKHPEKIKALAPISTVISGKLSLQTPQFRDDWKDWEQTGWRQDKSESVPGRTKRLPWSHMADRLTYDILPEATKLTMPVLCIVGDQDKGTPPEHQELLYEKLPGEKELHIIQGAPHTFKDQSHLAQIKAIFEKWIDQVEEKQK